MGRHISIHALLAESDKSLLTSVVNSTDFYPRSPCGERPSKKYPVILGRGISIHALLAESDAMQIVIVVVHALFLSTLSLRRATFKLAQRNIINQNFYPRSPCGERLLRNKIIWLHSKFLSTLSLRRATANGCTTVPNFRYFYPRSPCGERRLSISKTVRRIWHFYPRSPCGERHYLPVLFLR